MTTIVGTILAFVYLDPPWPWLVAAVLVATDIVQIRIWLRLRRQRARAGPEAMVGQAGRALTDLRPDGQVKVRGQIWKARSSAGVSSGEEVQVVAVEGLRLEVAPRRRAGVP